MKQQSPLTVGILTIVTFGIYWIVYLVKTNKFFRSQGYNVRQNWWFYASYIALPIFFVVVFSLALMSDSSNSNSMAWLGFGFLFLLLVFLVVTTVMFYMAIWRYLQAAQNYTNGGVDPIIHIALLLFFPIAVPMLLQHEYNKFLGGAPIPNGQNFQPNPQVQQQPAQPTQPQPQQNPQDPQQKTENPPQTPPSNQ